MDGIFGERRRNYERNPGGRGSDAADWVRWIEDRELEGTNSESVFHGFMRASVSPLNTVREKVTIAIYLPNDRPFPSA